MNDKQAFAVIVGGISFALFGGIVLLVLARLIVYVCGGHADGCDDIGWGVLWLLSTVFSGIVGAILSAKWARKRYTE